MTWYWRCWGKSKSGNAVETVSTYTSTGFTYSGSHQARAAADGENDGPEPSGVAEHPPGRAQDADRSACLCSYTIQRAVTMTV